MTRLERRAAVKRAWVDAGGKPNQSKLSRQLGVTRTTIANDLRIIREQTALETDTDAKREEAVVRYEAIYEYAQERAMGTKHMNENARVGWARVAITAEEKLCDLLGLNAPHKAETKQEVTIRIAPPEGHPDVKPPVPPKHREIVQ